jgi:radical SAM protein with 4Fe4S-binding SPASM domain
MAWMKTPEALTRLPEILIQGRLSFNFDGVPLIAKQMSLQQKMNLIKVGLDEIFQSNWAHGLPPIIQLETTNICNLKCPLCPTGSYSLERSKGFMSLGTFQRILDDLGDVLIAVYLFCFGEPFMNKDLPKMIEECTARNILTLTSTNGHYLQTLDEALRVVDAGLTTLIIAIDGSTQDIYQRYRQGGDIEKVKRCTSLIEEAKARRKSKFPYTAIRCVVNNENQENLPDLERLARDLGVNMFTTKSLGCLTGSDKFKDYETSEKSMRRLEYSGSSGSSRRLTQCPFPFRQPIVFWDGTVVGCEYDHDLDMALGNIGERNFIDIWNSPNALKLRHSIRKEHDRPSFCCNCPYKNRVKEGTVLWCKELRSV